MSKINRGRAWPLGSSLTKKGVNFSVAAPEASQIELLIFNNSDDIKPKQIITLKEENRSGEYWHVEVEGLTIGCIYAYRVFGKEGSANNKFYPKKILLDPAARGITGWEQFRRELATGKKENMAGSLKGVVTERNKFDFQNHPRPLHPWNKTVIYELHVGGFTKSTDSLVSQDKKGTYLGLIEKIPYLKSIGVTTIELLPIFAFDSSDSPLGLENYWGYSPLNWFTPHIGFSTSKEPQEVRDEFKLFVATCHDNNVEVLIDVVYNHTTEGNKHGPIVSWKGFAESLYYYQDNDNNFLDVTGCGNTIAANRPIVRKLILESIKCWSNELGVDGFRFDLGIALSRGESLIPLNSPPLFEEIESDPLLSELKFISEPWDCGGLYKLSDFPAKRFTTWNGHFRDDIRKFWKGDKNSTWPLKDRLTGSCELYKDKYNSTKKSVNFITSHDGFTLFDLVNFSCKHNLSNGESNRDGENNNNSWNHGIEGPSSNKNLEILRRKQQRNIIATLLLSPGIPMLSMGDEVGRSQGGNNNTWCQNNSLGWMIWSPKDCDNDLKLFVTRVLRIRKLLGEFFSPEVIINSDSLEPELMINSQGFCLQWHGVKVNTPDWGSWSHTISYSINKNKQGAAIWVGLNAYDQSMRFALPKPISQWEKLIDTKNLFEEDNNHQKLLSQNEICLESRSFVLIATQEYADKLKI